jgi:sterol desaturase/sphingolipid hydroxylase (fatty acid hydroxylase superfamily)
VHHSVEHMDWIAGSRLHFLEPLVTRTLVLIPAPRSTPGTSPASFARISARRTASPRPFAPVSRW